MLVNFCSRAVAFFNSGVIKMVFETVLSSLLNSVLGDYLENLDASQLNIAILRGHLVLTNLRLKQTALVRVLIFLYTVGLIFILLTILYL